MIRDLYCWLMQKCFNSRFIIVHPNIDFGRSKIVRRIVLNKNEYGFWSNFMGKFDPVDYRRDFHSIDDDGIVIDLLHMCIYTSWEPYIPFETKLKEKKIPAEKPKFPTYNK